MSKEPHALTPMYERHKEMKRLVKVNKVTK